MNRSPLNWKAIQRTNITKVSELIDFLQLDPLNAARILKRPSFPLNVPKRLANKMQKNCLTDPLFLQFVALDLEEQNSLGFTKDPIEESSFQITPRLLKKYAGRALLVTTACALHCRYCFRRHFPYQKSTSLFTEEINYIRQDQSLIEVILSGGDPLSMNDDKLNELLQSLDSIDHLHLIRIHTRFPIGIPERITPSIVSTLKNLRKKCVIVFHINHPSEIDEDVKRAIHLLKPLQLLNQSVLLKGVNDSHETLKALSLKLISCGVMPYYLHQLDQIQGGEHFEVPKEEGTMLIESLREALPGYLVPKYVQEIPHHTSKTPIYTEVCRE
ncbi:MAG: KamA family radical SAM protein [Simkaniaceae bacterium]|nr:KamA family radical SAM protein [Simkaniaceae bacterium]MCF7852287.1 KamA family radical SAM protein [Simkaniaceae bacterium]